MFEISNLKITKSNPSHFLVTKFWSFCLTVPQTTLSQFLSPSLFPLPLLSFFSSLFFLPLFSLFHSLLPLSPLSPYPSPSRSNLNTHECILTKGWYKVPRTIFFRIPEQYLSKQTKTHSSMSNLTTNRITFFQLLNSKHSTHILTT